MYSVKIIFKFFLEKLKHSMTQHDENYMYFVNVT